MKKLLIPLLIAITIGTIQTSIARPAGEGSTGQILCEIAREGFLYEMNNAKTSKEKKEVRESWKNTRPSWIARCAVGTGGL